MKHTCLIIDDEVLAREVIRTFLHDDLSIEVIGEASNGSEAVVKILQHRPDLIFIDIQMPELDGFGVLKEIWPHHQPFVVFTTAYDQYALRAFEVNAIDYLLKPFDEIRFHQSLGRAKERLSQRAQPKIEELVNSLLREQKDKPGNYLQRILVKEAGKMYLVKTEDISHFSADGNYISVFTNLKTYTIYESLSSLEARLDPDVMIRVGRSNIVNMNYISELETYFNGEYIIHLSTGDKVKWTRGYRDNIKAFLSKIG
ncbi:LytR/AlgR family response regulator transcription factor [Dyadobacter aurulentus]|uniref:LytR/AlgR family response regulator transcription factor n=1 Tax=Dyadobacter sp. UC 10 TaxID=2605428 RepID=UPI0011F1FEC1|nr:LytTR family DNA-binding domain-containing protein [Dyadobacter sp. UC 10]KAA0993281.1 response regulator transcription factor [Dyadobacter sp. UC 10]